MHTHPNGMAEQNDRIISSWAWKENYCWTSKMPQNSYGQKLSIQHFTYVIGWLPEAVVRIKHHVRLYKANGHMYDTLKSLGHVCSYIHQLRPAKTNLMQGQSQEYWLYIVKERHTNYDV